QTIFPPHIRPDLSLPRRMGFRGNDLQVLEDLSREMPLLLAACYSPSSMWTANWATVSPSADSLDGKVHLTPANLQNKIHRCIESPTTSRILRAIFRSPERFEHHQPLPSTAALGDEGAANHTRLAADYGARGVQLFVYGQSTINPWGPRPKIFPARQTMESCLVLQRLHRVPDPQVVLAQQNPDVIDQGVFHNDVISVGNLGVFLFHEEAFLGTARVIEELQRKYEQIAGGSLKLIPVTGDEVPVNQAVATYLFNSQLGALPSGRTLLVAPKECEENDRVRAFIARLVEGDGPIDEVRYFDLRQSMHGGGGPACLRLRVVLTEREEQAIAPGVRFSPELDRTLVDWIEGHYRDRLAPHDLADPALLSEAQTALDELSRLLGLGSLYPFQLT